MQEQELKKAQVKVNISPAGCRIGKKAIQLTNICKAYKYRTLIQDFTYSFTLEHRKPKTLRMFRNQVSQNFT